MLHDLIVVVLGTEDSMERGRVSGLLARYALQAFYGEGEASGDGTAGQDGTTPGLPVHAEAAVGRIIRGVVR